VPSHRILRSPSRPWTSLAGAFNWPCPLPAQPASFAKLPSILPVDARKRKCRAPSRDVSCRGVHKRHRSGWLPPPRLRLRQPAAPQPRTPRSSLLGRSLVSV
jgi:hypothetical protein